MTNPPSSPLAPRSRTPTPEFTAKDRPTRGDVAEALVLNCQHRKFDAQLWALLQAGDPWTMWQHLNNFDRANDDPSKHTKAIKVWNQTGRKKKGEQSDRTQKIANACKDRDSWLCILTKSGAVEAARLHPYSGFDKNASGELWEVLRMFWSEDQVSRWESAIFGSAGDTLGTEIVTNMITFSCDIRKYHTKAYFALEPLEPLDNDDPATEDPWTLKFKFH